MVRLRRSWVGFCDRGYLFKKGVEKPSLVHEHGTVSIFNADLDAGRNAERPDYAETRR